MSRTENIDLVREIYEKRRAKEEAHRLKVKERRSQVNLPSEQSNDPTPRQLEFLEFIRRHILHHGLPPTIREIGEAMGVKSPNGVMCHIKSLRRKGLMRCVGYGKSRGWMPVVDEGCCPCCTRKLDQEN
jgi:LexA DNA binding domain-containing protein